MARIVALALAMLLGASAWAADGSAPAPVPAPDPAAEICAKTACRTGGYRIAVAVDKEHYTELSVSHSPYVTEDGAILIFPGETLVFKLPLQDGKIGTPEFVAEYAPEMPMEPLPGEAAPAPRDLPKLSGEMPADILAPFPEGTLIVSYGQHGREPSMFLTLLHNLPKTVKLDAVMAIIKPGRYELHGTSTCPLTPKVYGLETWPHPIGPMFLKNFRVLPEGGGMVCD